MAWILLVVAGLLEVVWAIGMKQSQGFTKLWPSVWTIDAMLASFGLLAVAMRTLPLGISYTVWVGIGAVGSVIAGAALFGEHERGAVRVRGDDRAGDRGAEGRDFRQSPGPASSVAPAEGPGGP